MVKVFQVVAQQVPEFVNDVANQAKDTFGDDAFSQKSFFRCSNPQLGLGNILQRPLFRQAGGPVDSDTTDMSQMAAMGQQFLLPEAQQAPAQVDPQQAAMVQAQEQDHMEDGQKVGEMYASEMMNRITAEDPKDMIDAIRGNEKPLKRGTRNLQGMSGLMQIKHQCIGNGAADHNDDRRGRGRQRHW